jgi:hypothetical protein
MADPGGENQIIMFKSCFPNSNLAGEAADPPARGDGLTVGNAKAIYNELLKYFATRSDKLFVAITAPPVQDRSHAANARAFNNWLVKQWLANYAGKNVAVFDFYNVLTGPANHHRYHKGQIEHIYQAGRDTLHYPSNGDDHPSQAGNRKATEEFVPLLNVYYHRWIATAPPPGRPMALPLETRPAATEPERKAELSKSHAPQAAGVIDSAWKSGFFASFSTRPGTRRSPSVLATTRLSRTSCLSGSGATSDGGAAITETEKSRDANIGITLAETTIRAARGASTRFTVRLPRTDVIAHERERDFRAFETWSRSDVAASRRRRSFHYPRGQGVAAVGIRCDTVNHGTIG